MLKEINASALVVDTRAELAGMSDAAIDAAAAEAKKRGKDGKFVVALGNTTGQAPLAVLTNRAVRERLMAASLARGSHGGEFDNRSVVTRLAKLRAERAALLGYPNYAAYSLEDQTAKDTGRRQQAAGRTGQAGRRQRAQGSGRNPEGDRRRKRRLPDRRGRLGLLHRQGARGRNSTSTRASSSRISS